MRNHDAVADQIHDYEVRCFHGKQCPGGNQNGVSRSNLEKEIRQRKGGPVNLPTFLVLVFPDFNE